MDTLTITRDDVIRAGACATGVYEWCDKNHVTTTVMPINDVLRFCGPDQFGYVLRAAGLTGDGYGYGYGDGYGDGDGYGYGDGDGYGDGYGDG